MWWLIYQTFAGTLLHHFATQRPQHTPSQGKVRQHVYWHHKAPHVPIDGVMARFWILQPMLRSDARQATANIR